MRDLHRSVVDHHHKVVEGIADGVGRRSASDHHVAAEIGLAPLHGATDEILPLDGGLIVDSKTHNCFTTVRLEGGFLFRRQIAMAVVVSRS